MKQIKIAVAEKHDQLRDVLSSVLRSNSEFQIAFDSPGSFDLLDQLCKVEVDVLLLSSRLLSFNAIDLLKLIRSHESFSNLKIIILTSELEPFIFKKAAEYGANSLIQEHIDLEDMEHCIQMVYENNYHFNKFFTPELIPISN